MIKKTSKDGDTFYWEYDKEGHEARFINTYEEDRSIGLMLLQEIKYEL